MPNATFCQWLPVTASASPAHCMLRCSAAPNFGHASAVLLEAPVELASRTAGIVQLLLACCLDDHLDAQSRESRGPEHDDP